MEERDGVVHEPDLPRMRRERLAKLDARLEQAGIDAALLLTTGGVLYATGADLPAADTSRAHTQRSAALVVVGDPVPHLFTPHVGVAPPELPADHLHPGLDLETTAGAAGVGEAIREALGGRDLSRLGVDDLPAPLWFALPDVLPGVELADAGAALTAARMHKTPDEVACMRHSWQITEQATRAAEAMLRPGVRLSELSGTYLAALFELGATTNFLDPVFQAMPERIEDGPWSTNGDIPFNLVTTDHIVHEGEVIWTDTVSGFQGYASDVGRTWVVGDPSPTLRDLERRWQETTDAVLDHIGPGVTARELTTVAVEAHGGGRKPWLAHFFLGHTLGLEGGEMQHIGSDKGEAYDEHVLEPGMAVVIEPVTWQDGHAGWRCEELVVVTDDGHDRISAYPSEPVRA